MFTSEYFKEHVPEFSKFHYMFTRKSQTLWDILDINQEQPYCTDLMYDESTGHIIAPEGIAVPTDVKLNIVDNFNMFRNRPEYMVGAHVDSSLGSTYAIDLYETLIVGVALIRAFKNNTNPDSAFPKVLKCLEWLRTTDFYQAPASSIYHESHYGGLLKHTLEVVNQIGYLHQVPKFQKVNIEDAVLVALVHDWCKIGLYEQYEKNVKNDKTGQWEKVAAYKRKDPMLPLGHGVASMFLARSYFRLSKDEALAIRWHMGRWNVVREELNELQHSNEVAPLVLMLQFADHLSITAY